ncbi:MAG: type II secretion system protein [Sedimentisphaerales bacterium]|nr:type II secretion system protein [Sedimentisphaerales bacterium]
MKTRAFTLIELLVVIAIIAVLMAILLPSLNIARDQAKRLHCISNVKNMTFGWLLYKDDNDAKMIGGFPGRSSDAWMLGPSGNDPDPVEQCKEGLRNGLLFPYIKSLDVYRCPSDDRIKRQGMYTFGSYSISGALNGEEKEWSNRHLILYSEIKKPFETFVFVEEIDPRGYNMGSWVVTKDFGNSWIDPLAIWHSKNRSTLGFADGSAYMHQWVNQSTIDIAMRAAWGDESVFNFSPPADERDDLRYMQQRYPVLDRARTQ